MIRRNKIIIISGTSGSGKTTLINHLMNKEELNLTFSISACSRKRRPLEEHGKDYFFLSPQKFLQKIKNNDFIEWEEVYPNNFYGTLKSSVDNIIQSGKNILFDVDVKGALSIKEYFQDQACTIFIQPPSLEVAEQRLRARQTESEKDLLVRVNKMKKEIRFSNKMDYRLINDDLKIARTELYNYVVKFLKL